MTSPVRHNFRLVRQRMGLMTSQLRTFQPRSILWAFLVPKFILLYTKAGRSAHPYSINFAIWLVTRSNFSSMKSTPVLICDERESSREFPIPVQGFSSLTSNFFLNNRSGPKREKKWNRRFFFRWAKFRQVGGPSVFLTADHSKINDDELF